MNKNPNLGDGDRSETTTETTVATRRHRGPIGAARAFLRHVPQVPWASWLACGACIIFGFVLVVLKFNDLNAHERDRIVAEREQKDFELEITSWNQARVVYTACLESVERSDGNREFKTWMLDAIEKLFPGSDKAAEFVTEGRQKLDELLPARSPEECVDPGPKPTR